MRLFGLAASVLAVVALLVAAAAGAFAQGSYGAKGAPPPPGPAELAKLAQIALRSATFAGDAHPTDGVVVPSTRLTAEWVDGGAIIDSNQPVYFVLLHGHFRIDRGPPRLLATFGKLPILTLTIDARTNKGTDGGVESRMPDLYAIGIAEPLPLQAGG
jgi:hypothetical protein